MVDGARSMVRVERTRGDVSGRGLVLQQPKTDAGVRVVMLPDRVWAPGREVALTIPRRCCSQPSGQATCRGRRAGRGSGTTPARRPLYRSLASTISTHLA